MSIFASRWLRTQDMTKVGTAETKLAVWDFGDPAQWDGHDAIGADRKFSYSDGARLRISGASTLKGTGTLTMKLYRGTKGTAEKLVNTYGPYTIAQLQEFEKEMESFKFPPTSEGGTTFQMSFTGSAEAGTGFSAGSLSVYVEFD